MTFYKDVLYGRYLFTFELISESLCKFRFWSPCAFVALMAKYFESSYWASQWVEIISKVNFTSLLKSFLLCVTQRQITALIFFLPLTNNCPHFFAITKTITKIAGKGRKSLILKVKK